MTTSTRTPRQSFRATVALVAARAKEKLPQEVNGRIEAGARLVLLNDVRVLDDGTVEVGSSSDPMKTYTVAGKVCDCQDFAYGKAPQGWCQHRLAVAIQQRVQELMPVELPVEPWGDNDLEEAPAPELAEAPAPVAAPAPLPEAPASVNVRVVIGGREVQWTLRDTDEARLAVRLEALLQRFPLPQPQPPAQPPSTPAHHRPVEGACPIHSVPMHWNEGKEGRKGWWSHRTADGQWCKGR